MLWVCWLHPHSCKVSPCNPSSSWHVVLVCRDAEGKPRCIDNTCPHRQAGKGVGGGSTWAWGGLRAVPSTLLARLGVPLSVPLPAHALTFARRGAPLSEGWVEHGKDGHSCVVSALEVPGAVGKQGSSPMCNCAPAGAAQQLPVFSSGACSQSCVSSQRRRSAPTMPGPWTARACCVTSRLVCCGACAVACSRVSGGNVTAGACQQMSLLPANPHACLVRRCTRQAAEHKGEWAQRPLVDSWPGEAAPWEWDHADAPLPADASATTGQSAKCSLSDQSSARCPVCFSTPSSCSSSFTSSPTIPPHPTHPTAVEEKGGFVWVFYGSKSLPAEERPPIPYVPELGRW